MIPEPGNILGLIISVVYLLVIYIVADNVRRKNIRSNPIYRYYIPGLFVKIFGGIALGLVYIYYYGAGGDTTAYHRGAAALVNLFFKNPVDYLTVFLGEVNVENFSLFDNSTGYPNWTMYRDAKTYFVIRLIHPLLFISFKCYFPTAILIAWLTYTGIWHLFKMFCEFYPKLTRHFAISILYMPSVVFWGSGILKDSFTLSAACWFTYSIYSIFIKRKKLSFHIICLFISAYLLMSLKPYIFVALMPGALMWASFEKIQSIKNTLLRVIFLPLILTVTMYIIALIFSKVSGEFGKWGSVDKMLVTAAVNQEDLTRSGQYGDHYFDIGEFEPTISSVVKKAPLAITATLYRPFIWEAGNIVMLLSALENTFILGLSIWLLFKVGIFKIINFIRITPLLLFSMLFSLFFAFAVGLSTANFGALVRYKIPAIPFFLSSLFILRYLYIESMKRGEVKRT